MYLMGLAGRRPRPVLPGSLDPENLVVCSDSGSCFHFPCFKMS